MNEAFERHLKELTFQKQFEKAKTVEEKLAFCKAYIEKYDIKPVYDEPTNTEGETTILSHNMVISSFEMNLLDDPNFEDECRKRLMRHLIQEAEKFATFTSSRNQEDLSCIIRVKLGVFKP